MSTMPAVELFKREALQYEPSTSQRVQLAHVMVNLTEVGAEQLSTEIFEAMADAQDKGDPAPLDRCVEAWYRTLLALAADYEGVSAALQQSMRRGRPGTGLTPEEVQHRLLST